MAEKKQEQAEAKGPEVQEEQGLLDQLLSRVSIETPGEAQTLDDVIAKESAGGRLSFAINHLIEAVASTGAQVETVDKVLLESIIAQIDKKVSDQLNEVMHHEKFKEIEASWTGLKYAVDKTDFRKNIRMEIINCSKTKMMEDFEDTPEVLQSGMYKQLYEDEYDQPGAAPVSCVTANYEFDRSLQDMALLQNISKVAAATHAPFLGSVGASFFGEKSIESLPSNPGEIAEIFEQAEYMRWNSFRSSEDSRYVGLTMNKFILRLPYGSETVPVRSFDFEEDVTGGSEEYLWGNPAFAFLGNINQCFAKHGWAVNIRGPKAGGKVSDLPVHVYQATSGTQIRIPTEIILSERKEVELAESGFIPLSVYKNQDFAVFFSAYSAQKPKKYSTSEATANSKLSANLPYLFLVSRLAHYLKVLQREEIGGAKEKEDIQQEMDEWINSLVTQASSPDAEQKAKYPLRAASVEVSDYEDAPGYYHVSMKVRPHFQVEGVNVDLSLVSKVPKASKK